MLQDQCDSQTPHPAHRHCKKVIYDWLTTNKFLLYKLLDSHWKSYCAPTTSNLSMDQIYHYRSSIAPPHDENRGDVQKHRSGDFCRRHVEKSNEDEFKIVICLLQSVASRDLFFWGVYSSNLPTETDRALNRQRFFSLKFPSLVWEFHEKKHVTYSMI